MKNENKDYKFIQKFNKITLTYICKKLGLNRSIVSSGKASDEVYALIKQNILLEIENAKLSNNEQ